MLPATLLALLLSAPAPAAPPPAASTTSPVAPTVHLSIGTGSCSRSEVPGTGLRGANPCYLVFGVAATLRHRLLEAGLSYEGRQPVDLLSLFSFRPPTTTVVGGTAGITGMSGERWRLSLAGEAGWRRYTHFAGHGPDAWRGDADLAYAGLTGRAATGLRNPAGRTDRVEVTVAWRHDLSTATVAVAGQPWRVGGWSLTLGVGLVADW